MSKFGVSVLILVGLLGWLIAFFKAGAVLGPNAAMFVGGWLACFALTVFFLAAWAKCSEWLDSVFPPKSAPFPEPPHE